MNVGMAGKLKILVLDDETPVATLTTFLTVKPNFHERMPR
jgi:hypothetical protein